MLAQITNQLGNGNLPDPRSPAAIGWFCIIAVCVIMGLKAGIDLWRTLTRPSGPERRDVTISSGAVSAADFGKHIDWDADEHSKLFSKIGGVERGAAAALMGQIETLRTERSKDAGRLQDKLSVIDRSLGGLEKSTEIQNQSLTQIQSTMNQVLQKVGAHK